ncbi:LysM peptidoglycan-binding domain-containing protein [Fulvivirga sp. RKSG066]|uniref:CIS tube protein n=1 Tax=Fulvivirga aurantia TaxID=2529383 RepID=UPI0012BD354C|nr:LysM peptidoglycan-binding domain-containing protein [Fulvivirga aurantia]MTI22456.1 LysM peptidoglycan-binding domain-containing protein [Fulvivirga aurantia]
MAGLDSDSKLKKLKIISYDDQKYTKKRQELSVMINPSSIAHSHSINYNADQAPDTIGPENKFKNVGPESVSFELVFDGTGATGEVRDVHEEIEKLKEATYYYIGEEHQTPFVQLSWGTSFTFYGRLTSLEVTHTMFSPDGTSIRAKAKVAFENSMDPETQAKKTNKSSPDLSHVVTVKMGDNLPMLCEKIYGDSSYYLQVARVNNLVNFRNLEPGAELMFPPVKK